MSRIRSISQSLLPARLNDSDGFTLVEAIVALSVLATFMTAFTYSIQMMLMTTRDDRARLQATELAARELEVVRNEFAKGADEQSAVLAASYEVNAYPLPGGTAGQPLVLDGRSYTVERTHQLLPTGTGASPCDGGSTTGYLSLAVNVKVRWSDGNMAKSVENNTVLTPRKGTVGTLGFIAAKLTNAAGTGTPSVPVSANGPGGTQVRYTADDGCAVFAYSNPGQYSLRLDASGYVNPDGIRTVAKSSALSLGSINVVPFAYDRAATLAIRQVTTSGHSVPADLPWLTLANPGIAPLGEKSVETTSNPMSTSGLWPFPDGYSIWAGTCDENDPGLNPSGFPRPSKTALTSGANVTVEAFLGPVDITAEEVDFDSGSTTAASGVALLARPTGGPLNSCDGDDAELRLGQTDSSGTLRSSLPSGTWEVFPDPSSHPASYCNGSDTETNCAVRTEPIVVVDEVGAPPATATAQQIRLVVRDP